MSRSTGNRTDYESVLLGRGHNLGAGGVGRDGRVQLFDRPIPVADKRINQWFERTNRAVGERR